METLVHIEISRLVRKEKKTGRKVNSFDSGLQNLGVALQPKKK